MDEIKYSSKDLETKLGEPKQASARKILAVDTAGNISYSLIVGSILDYSAGLNLTGIIASRTSATAINAVTGGPYGWWREKICKFTKTNEKSGKIKKTLTDLLSFVTFQVPQYAIVVSVGSLISEGKIDTEKVQKGMIYLTTISPLIAPTMGYFMDCFRKIFRVKSAAEGAYGKNKND